MKLNRKQWLALACVLGLGLWAVMSFTGNDENADAIQCHANGGVYMWHRHECFPRTARIN